MNVCAHVVCAAAVEPLQGAIAPCAPPIFEAIAGITVCWVASYRENWNCASTPRVVSAKNANCASPPRLVTVGGDDSPRRSLTALPHCCADSRHSRRGIGASGVQAVEPVLPPPPPVPPVPPPGGGGRGAGGGRAAAPVPPPPPPPPPVPPMQTPFVHVPLQGWLQPPQCWTLVATSTHIAGAPHIIWLGPQAHVPPTQVAP